MLGLFVGILNCRVDRCLLDVLRGWPGRRSGWKRSFGFDLADGVRFYDMRMLAGADVHKTFCGWF